jgi:4-oxalocrotonate tautomerase
MPIITVSLYSGRIQRDKDRLAEAITADIENILKVPRKDVIIAFQEALMEIGMLQEYVFNKQ